MVKSVRAFAQRRDRLQEQIVAHGKRPLVACVLALYDLGHALVPSSVDGGHSRLRRCCRGPTPRWRAAPCEIPRPEAISSAPIAAPDSTIASRTPSMPTAGPTADPGRDGSCHLALAGPARRSARPSRSRTHPGPRRYAIRPLSVPIDVVGQIQHGGAAQLAFFFLERLVIDTMNTAIPIASTADRRLDSMSTISADIGAAPSPVHYSISRPSGRRGILRSP